MQFDYKSYLYWPLTDTKPPPCTQVQSIHIAYYDHNVHRYMVEDLLNCTDTPVNSQLTEKFFSQTDEVFNLQCSNEKLDQVIDHALKNHMFQPFSLFSI